MSTATALKFQNDAKQMAVKRLQERKKSLLVLILRHLADSDYIETYRKLETEAGLNLSQVTRLTRCMTSRALRQLAHAELKKV